MSKRSCWALVIAVSCVIGTIGIAPADAKGGQSGPSTPARPATLPRSNNAAVRIITRQLAARDNRWRRVHDQSTTVSPGWGWPYLPLLDTAPLSTTQTGTDGPSDPYVIVMSNPPGRAPNGTASVALGDYSYAGCHAIPNGYHCDSPRSQATP
jgi:hypothetical protein